jgi:hypothetical protein
MRELWGWGTFAMTKSLCDSVVDVFNLACNLRELSVAEQLLLIVQDLSRQNHPGASSSLPSAQERKSASGFFGTPYKKQAKQLLGLLW